ncbi:GumC family protein [Rubripirellula reticaptiva]|uniref:Chromosome partition protein Smc n=1 Tax=Rubripirellula reticaptiva TaxID=2528013 RepID=A0A5C6EKP1_9BACT|nr:hypothetical protein [Rubripirellula reticaptiva]TWU49388.1 Chromosome partition protein Smc [Rubripirellula reticaptiva]
MPNSLEQWTYAIKRHWLLAFLIFVSVMSVTVMVILFAPRAYHSEAKLLLRIGRESVSLDPTANSVGETISLQQTRENEIQSAIGVMHSREILERVIDQIGVDVVIKGTKQAEDDGSGEAGESIIPKWLAENIAKAKGKVSSIDPVTPREVALTSLAKGIGIYAASESSVVSIGYKTKSPDVAQAVVAAWVDSYLEQHSKVNRTPGTFAFFTEQGVALRDQLSQARADLYQIKNKSNLVTIDGQQKLIEAQLSKVRDSLIETDSEIASLGSRLKSYDKMLTGFDETITEEVTGIADEGRAMMRNQLFDLEVQQKDLLSKYNAGHPKLVAIERQLEEAAKIVNEQDNERVEVTRSVNPAYQQLVEYRMLDEATLSGATEKQKSLLLKKTAIEAELAELNRNEQSIATASNEVTLLEDRYARHSEKLEQARLDEVLADQQFTSVNVVQSASLEERPVTPNKGLCAVAGFLAACAAAISLPVLLEIRGSRQREIAATRANHRDWKFEQRGEASEKESSIGSPHYETDISKSSHSMSAKPVGISEVATANKN